MHVHILSRARKYMYIQLCTWTYQCHTQHTYSNTQSTAVAHIHYTHCTCILLLNTVLCTVHVCVCVCVCVGYEVHKKPDLEDQILAHCIFLKMNIYTETQPVHHTREGERERGERYICKAHPDGF